MQNLNEMELQQLRHIIGAHETSYSKMDDYAQRCSDPQIRQFFQKSAQGAQQSKQQLISFLQ